MHGRQIIISNLVALPHQNGYATSHLCYELTSKHQWTQRTPHTHSFYEPHLSHGYESILYLGHSIIVSRRNQNKACIDSHGNQNIKSVCSQGIQIWGGGTLLIPPYWGWNITFNGIFFQK